MKTLFVTDVANIFESVQKWFGKFAIIFLPLDLNLGFKFGTHISHIFAVLCHATVWEVFTQLAQNFYDHTMTPGWQESIGITGWIGQNNELKRNFIPKCPIFIRIVPRMLPSACKMFVDCFMYPKMIEMIHLSSSIRNKQKLQVEIIL